MDYWDFLDTERPGCEGVRALWNWSLNCEHPTPAAVFADLTGVSDDLTGVSLAGADWECIQSRLGYLELDYLADALKEYAANPDGVRVYVRDLLEAEGDL